MTTDTVESGLDLPRSDLLEHFLSHRRGFAAPVKKALAGIHIKNNPQTIDELRSEVGFE